MIQEIKHGDHELTNNTNNYLYEVIKRSVQEETNRFNKEFSQKMKRMIQKVDDDNKKLLLTAKDEMREYCDTQIFLLRGEMEKLLFFVNKEMDNMSVAVQDNRLLTFAYVNKTDLLSTEVDHLKISWKNFTNSWIIDRDGRCWILNHNL